MEMTEGDIFEGCIVVTIRKIIAEGVVIQGWIVMNIRKIIGI